MKTNPKISTPPPTPGVAPELKESWLAFEVEEFPPASLGRKVKGMLYEQVDAVAAGCISTFLRTGALDGECLALLDEALDRLNEMAALAPEGEDRTYFTRLLEIARGVRAAARPAP
jgi:hypothetical protein